MKKKSFMAAIIISAFIATTIITPFFSIVAGEEFTAIYDGDIAPNRQQEPPQFRFFKYGTGDTFKNGSVINTQNFTIVVIPAIDYGDGFYVNLHQVSYKASWQDKSVVIYQWSINDKTKISDVTRKGTNTILYNLSLTNVPEGSNQIEFTAVGGGIYIGWGHPNTYKFFTITGSASLDFTVAVPEVEPEPFPFVPVAAASVASVAIIGIGLLVYFKKRKH